MARSSMSHPLAYAIACALVFLAAPSYGADDLKTLQLEQYLDFEQVSDPQLSPDGKRIVYQPAVTSTRSMTSESQPCG